MESNYPPGYYEEPMYEPSEADGIMEDFVSQMTEALNKRVKQEIEHYKLENESLKRRIEALYERESEIKSKERALQRTTEDIRREVRQLRLSELLSGFSVVLYKVTRINKNYPKCDKCDEERKISFESPQGNMLKENCNCSKGYTIFEPLEMVCVEFKIATNGNKLCVWYRNIREMDYDWCKMTSADFLETVYDGACNFEKLDQGKTFFRDKSDCQRYCDWLNQRGK